uniref:Ig-like domain-containing protein n=1 Tax=Scleropages formosus TaxID=113540 RepID=A0A8C9R981_SCLFO
MTTVLSPNCLSAMATFISGHSPFPELTVVALINDVPVEYYDSNIQEFVSRRHWRVNDTIEGIDLKNFAAAKFSTAMRIMMNQFNHTTGLHVLQWFASALLQDEKLITAFFKLAYAGMEILRYNSLTNELSAPPQRDLNTKQQGERSLISDGSLTGSDLCDPSVQPTVRVIRKTEPDSGRTRVSCVATGFYPRRVNVTLLRDDRPVPDRELTGGQVLPNGDGTYQLRRSLSVSEEELRERHRYTCTVSHLSVDNKLDVNWGKTPVRLDSPADTVLISAVLIAVLGLTALIIIIITATVLWRRRRHAGEALGRILKTVPITENCLCFCIIRIWSRRPFPLFDHSVFLLPRSSGEQQRNLCCYEIHCSAQ